MPAGTVPPVRRLRAVVGPAGIEPTTSTVEPRQFERLAENVTRIRPRFGEHVTAAGTDNALTHARVVNPVARIGSAS